jgi:hypothetical protein
MNITLNVSGTQPSVKLADEAAARDLTSLLPSPSRCNFQASNASLTSRRGSPPESAPDAAEAAPGDIDCYSSVASQHYWGVTR